MMKKQGLVAFVAACVLVVATVFATVWLMDPEDGSDDGPGSKAGSKSSWLDELAGTGLEPGDPDRLWELINTKTCKSDDYDLYVTLGRGPEAMSLSQERVGIKHACPNRLDDWDDAIVKLGDTNDRVDFLCDTPLEDLSLEESDGGVSDREEAMIVCDQYQGPEWEDYYDEHFVG